MPITRAYGQASQLGNTPAASNPVLNSAFQIWQRGTSFSAGVGAAYNADRWYHDGATGRTISRQTTGDTTNLPNIQYCLRIQRDSGSTATTNSIVSQSFETVNSIPFVGKTVTLSFYARRGANFSSTSNSLSFYLVSGTGTDQNQRGGYTNQALPINTAATLTTTWQRFQAVGTVASTATELAVVFEYAPTGTAGAADYFEVTGVQLDVGSVALPFRTYSATLAGELAACQRYYQQVLTGTKALGIGSYYSASAMGAYVYLTVEMRTTPTLSATSGTNYYAIYAPTGDAFDSLTLSGDTTARLLFLTNSSQVSGTAGYAGEVYGNSASASVGVSAEL